MKEKVKALRKRIDEMAVSGAICSNQAADLHLDINRHEKDNDVEAIHWMTVWAN